MADQVLTLTPAHNHAWCGQCRPDILPKISVASKGRKSWIEGLTFEQAYGVERGTEIKNRISQSCIGRPSAYAGRVSSEDTKRRISERRRGQRASEETRAKISLGVSKAIVEGRCRPWFGKPTNLEFALQRLLEDAGLEYEAQKRFGRRAVDFYVSSHNLAFEADGQYWAHHQDVEREVARDTELLRLGIAAVIHLTDDDLDPWLLKGERSWQIRS